MEGEDLTLQVHTYIGEQMNIANPDATADFERAEYVSQKIRWDRISALCEDYLDIRNHKDIKKYLLEMPAEDPEVYEDRLKRVSVWSATYDTLKGMVGILTAKGYSIETIKNEELRRQIQNPLKGDGSLTKMLERYVEAVCRHGHALITVSPSSEVSRDRREDLERDRRVRWTIYTPHALINWSTDEEASAGDTQYANYLVFKQLKEEDSGDFGHAIVEEYLRVDQIGSQKYIKREGDDEPVKSGEFVPHTDIAGRPLGIIPVVTAYFHYLDPLVSRPPLNSISQLNIEHMNKQSNSDLAVRLSQFPIPVFSGLNKETAKKMGKVKSGPTTGLKLSGDVKFNLVETTGRSLDVGLKSLVELEKKLNQMSFKELIADPNISRDVTATEADIKHQSKLSPLAAAGIAIEDAVTQAIRIHAQYLGVTLGPEEVFKLSFDIAKVNLTSDEVRVLIELLQNRVITREMVYERISNGQYFNNDILFKDIQAKMDDESLEL